MRTYVKNVLPSDWCDGRYLDSSSGYLPLKCGAGYFLDGNLQVFLIVKQGADVNEYLGCLPYRSKG